MDNIVDDFVRVKLSIKQINLHHCKGATALIDRSMKRSQTNIDNQHVKNLVLVQEPWVRNGNIEGFDKSHNTVYSLTHGRRARTCIIAEKSLNLTLLPSFCDGDTTVVSIMTYEEGINKEILVCSGYLPYDSCGYVMNPKIVELIEYAKLQNIPVILGLDANAHHILWGSKDINDRGASLIEFISTTNLEILNRGNTPTFFNKNRSEVIDITLASSEISNNILNWEVSKEETLSDHRLITYKLCVGSPREIPFRNPRSTNWEKFAHDVSIAVTSSTWNCEPNNPTELDNTVDLLTGILTNSFKANCKISRPRKKNVPLVEH